MKIEKKDFYVELARFCERERKFIDDSKKKCNQLVSQQYMRQMASPDSMCPSSLIKDLDKYHSTVHALESVLKETLTVYNSLKINEKKTKIEDVTDVESNVHLGFFKKK